MLKLSLESTLDYYSVQYRPGMREQMVRCPAHGDSTPSMSVNLIKDVCNCLAGETLVQTREGVFPIAELAGGEHELLTTQGWRRAPIRSFGRQELFEITLSRNGVERKVYATAGHRWFTQTCERTTEQLRTNARLRHVSPPRSPARPSEWGIAHGFTFGDGHLDQRRRSCVASFHGEKGEMVPYFLGEAKVVAPGHLRIANLPANFKSLPSLVESASYLLGWLAGYFAADGTVGPNGAPVLSSARQEHLEYVEHMALTRLGIVSYGIRTANRKGIGGAWSDIHYLTFARSSLDEAFFLREKHRVRYVENRDVRERKGYAVKSVRPTGRLEEVYCAVVEGVGNFSLSGGLLTGNCHSCGMGGTPLNLIMEMEGLDAHGARAFAASNGIQSSDADEGGATLRWGRVPGRRLAGGQGDRPGHRRWVWTGGRNRSHS